MEGDQTLSTGDLLGLRQLQLGDQPEDVGLGHWPGFGRRDRPVEADAEVCREDRERPEATSRGRAAGRCQRH